MAERSALARLRAERVLRVAAKSPETMGELLDVVVGPDNWAWNRAEDGWTVFLRRPGEQVLVRRDGTWKWVWDGSAT